MPWKIHKYEFETVGIKKLLTDKPARVLFSSVSFCESNTNHVFFSSVGSKINRRTGIRITYYFCLNSVSQHSSPGSRKPSREFFLSKLKFEKHNNEKKKKKEWGKHVKEVSKSDFFIHSSFSAQMHLLTSMHRQGFNGCGFRVTVSDWRCRTRPSKNNTFLTTHT